jgi:outer membrane protein assembly factor BamB
MAAANVITPGVFAFGLLAGPDSLYATDGRDLMRIDPATGAVIARAPVDATAQPPVLAGGAIVMTTSTNTSSAVVQRFDPLTLRTLGSATVAFTDVNDGTFSLVARAGTGHVYLGAGNSIAVLDATTLAVQRRLSVSGGAVVTLASSSDGTVLYAGVQAGYEFALQTIDTASGRPIRTQPILASLLRGA